MPETTASQPVPSSDRSALGRVTLATVIAAASGYLVLLLAARDLGAAGYAVFAVFWAAYGMVTGAQNGQLQETTRAVHAAGSKPPVPATHPWRINAAIGLALAGLVVATSPLWSDRVFDEHRWLSVGLLGVGVALFAMYAHLCGALSGSMSWGAFATLLSIDAMIRLIGAVVATVAGLGLAAFLVITVSGSVSWLLVLAISPTARAAVGLPADVGSRTFTNHTVTAMAAALASAVLVMGFPVLIRATGTDDPADALGAVILAVTLTRAPLLVPLNSFQGVLIARFVGAGGRPWSAMRAPLALVTGVGIVGAAAAWVVGPWLLRTVFGSEFHLAGSTLALFTLGATTLALLTVTGAATLATGAHRPYAIGWWVATLASIGLLLLPIGVADRVAVALIAGPLIGMAVHAAGVGLRNRPSRAPSRD